MNKITTEIVKRDPNIFNLDYISKKDIPEGKLPLDSFKKESIIHSKIESDTYIGDYSYIGHNVKIGKNVKIQSNVHIADNCIIEDNCWIMSDIIIEENVHLCMGVIIHPTSTISKGSKLTRLF